MTYQNLMNKAIEQLKFAYCPYSKVKVAAALLTKEGKVYLGSNVENTSFGATICAERVALVKAVSEGNQNYTAIAVVSNLKGITPCGICRQMLFEFSQDIDVITQDKNSDKLIIQKLTYLLPDKFSL